MLSGAWNEVGIQATELLNSPFTASPSGVTHRQRSRGWTHTFKSLQSAWSFYCCNDFWSSGIGAPIISLTIHCGFVRCDSSGTSVRGLNVHPGGRGTAGSRNGLAVIITAGVACRPKLCAALRLKTFEARPDARCGPVRGKAASGFIRSVRRRYQRTMGAWCRWVRFSFGIIA